MKNKIAIIGAGPGIGQAIAHHFGQQGYDVVVVARHADRLQKLVAELQAAGIVATAVVADCGQPDQLTKALTGLDGLRAVHYNAAAMHSTDVLAETAESLTQDFAVNVAGLLTADNQRRAGQASPPSLRLAGPGQSSAGQPGR
jgi:NADP-dependent 3-hydroxy acid dehydrogenase YdfG